jgi:hypothetical protein
MILTALNNQGGVEYFEHISQTQPVAFCSLIGRILPTQVEGSDESPLTLTVVVGGESGGTANRDCQHDG